MTPRIETEALQALVIDHLSDLVAHFADEAAKLQREVERLRAVIEPFEGAAGIFDQNGKFVGGPSGECLCGFITGKDLIEAVKARRGE